MKWLWMFVFAAAVLTPLCLARNTAAVTIQVRDQTGLALSGADVTVASAKQTANTLPRTDSNGIVTFDLAPGSYEVSVKLKAFRTVTKEIMVTNTNRQTFAIVLPVGSCPPGPCLEVMPVTTPTQPAPFETGLRAELRGDDDGSILLSPNSRAHLHFILFSNADGLKVYQDWNSLGYRSRSFLAQDDKLKAYEITPPLVMHWTRNFPSTDTINKGDVLVTDVYLCDWRINPKLPPTAHGTTLRLTGRFTIQDTPANRKAVWTGNVETLPIKVTLDKACVAGLNAD